MRTVHRLRGYLPRSHRARRLLFVATCNATSPYMLEKLDQQYRALKPEFPRSRGVVVGKGNAWSDEQDFAFEFVNLGFNESQELARARSSAIGSAVREFRPDVVFMRYPYYKNGPLLNVVRRHGGFFLEHHTKELEEFRLGQNKRAIRQEERWGPRLRAAAMGLIAVTPEIEKYEIDQAASGWEDGTGLRRVPASLSVGNGTNPSAVLPLHSVQPPGGILNIVVVANLAKWQGVDRILEGMAQQPDRDVRLRIIGRGVELENLRQLARSLNLEGKATFLGHLEGQDLDDAFTGCHVAMGALARHRTGSASTSALKHREYALRGIPFAYSGSDADFDEHPEFVMRVPADDSPMMLDRFQDFALSFWESGQNAALREYARTELSWDRKMKVMADFMKLTYSDRRKSER